MSNLTFNNLRIANRLRLPQFKNKLGERAHHSTNGNEHSVDGSDWSPAQWLQALVGELGEFANIRKKYERGDLTFEQYEIEANKEIADIMTYLDLLALRCLDPAKRDVERLGFAHKTGIDLGAATVAKFNEVSIRVGSTIFLANGGWSVVDSTEHEIVDRGQL